jgi:hypothetical protein
VKNESQSRNPWTEWRILKSMKNALLSALQIGQSAGHIAMLFPAPGQDSAPGLVDAKVQAVLSQLPPGVPYITPAQLAPIFNISPNGVCKHCRGLRELKTWEGSYRFYTTDREHMEILIQLIKVMLFAGMKLPDDLRVRGGKSGGVQKVH